MAWEVKAPCRPAGVRNGRTVFLAGSIEMGIAEQWQERVVRMMDGISAVTLFNPRRDDWDNSWEQDIACEVFREQVEWELDHIAAADHVLIYFVADTKAPITLAELGYALGRNLRTVVVCPPGFYRRGNVQIMCARNGAAFFDTLEEGVAELRRRLGSDGCEKWTSPHAQWPPPKAKAAP